MSSIQHQSPARYPLAASHTASQARLRSLDLFEPGIAAPACCGLVPAPLCFGRGVRLGGGRSTIRHTFRLSAAVGVHSFGSHCRGTPQLEQRKRPVHSVVTRFPGRALRVTRTQQLGSSRCHRNSDTRLLFFWLSCRGLSSRRCLSETRSPLSLACCPCRRNKQAEVAIMAETEVATPPPVPTEEPIGKNAGDKREGRPERPKREPEEVPDMTVEEAQKALNALPKVCLVSLRTDWGAVGRQILIRFAFACQPCLACPYTPVWPR